MNTNFQKQAQISFLEKNAQPSYREFIKFYVKVTICYITLIYFIKKKKKQKK